MQSPGDPDRLSKRAQVAWLAVLPLFLYLLLTGAGASNGTYLTPFRVVSLVTLSALFIAWSLAAWLVPAARPRSAMAVPLAAAVGALAIATLLSDRARLGWEFVAYGGILSGLYLLLVRLLSHPGIARRIAVVTAACTLVVGIGYLGAVMLLWIRWWELVGHLAVPPTRPGYEALMYGAPGILTAFLACGGAASVALLWPMGRGQRILATAVAIVVGAGVFLAAARSGWLALGVAVVITAAVGLAAGGRVAVPRGRRARATLVGVILAAGAAAVAVAPAVLRRLATGGGEALRGDLSAVAARIFADHPWTGAGPGTWVTYRAAYTLPGETDYYIPHAHNMPLQVLAETGLVGAIAGLIVVTGTWRLVVPAIRSREPVARARALGVLFVACYLLVHQLFDFFMDMPAVLFAAALPLAAVDALTRKKPAGAAADAKQAVAAPPPITVGIPIALAAVTLGLLLVVERPALLGEAASAALADDPTQAMRLSDEALEADPQLPAYAWIRALAADEAGDVATAAAKFRDVAAFDDFAAAWLNLAALEVARGDSAQALADLEHALRLGVQQSGIAVAAVPLLLQLGRGDRAAEVAATALLLAPSLADDPWWDSDPDLAATRDEAVDIAAASGIVTAWQVAMVAGDTGRAWALAAGYEEPLRANAKLIIDAWAGGPGARQQLEDAAVANPLGGLAGWAARVAARDGDVTAAHRFREWAAIGYGTSGSDFGYDVTVAGDEVLVSGGPGANGSFHFRYTYRRSVPPVLPVRGLPRLVLR